MHSIFQDIRFGLRMLVKNPGFTFIAILTLTLAIGANTAVFSMFHALKMIPFRFEDPESLVYLWRQTEEYERASVSAPDFYDWRDQSRSFGQTAMYRFERGYVTGDGEPEEVRILCGSANLMSMVGIEPQLGRFPSADEESPVADKVVVLSNNIWQRRYGSDPEVLGRVLMFNNTPYTIIGVQPEEVSFEQFWSGVELFIPLVIEPSDLVRNNYAYTTIARLEPDVTMDQVQVEMDTIADQLARAYPETNEKSGIVVQSLIDSLIDDDVPLMEKLLLTSVGLVLLIACVNLANLLLAKATARTREFAVRAALGAGRGRIVRQLFIESLLLALPGGILGLLVADWGIGYFVKTRYVPFLILENEIGLSLPVIVYTLIISVMAAFIFGLLPALTTSKLSLFEDLKEGAAATSAGRGRNRLRHSLIVGQLAIAMPLLVVCGMITKHLVALRMLDLGYNTQGLIKMDVQLPDFRYQNIEQGKSFYRRAIAAIDVLPGVESAGGGMLLPVYQSTGWGAPVALEGYLDEQERTQSRTACQSVTPGFFPTLEAPLISGRFFNSNDHAEAQPVAMVNQRLAQRFWPGEDPVGKRVTMDPKADKLEWVTIVGVVGNTGCSFMGGPPPGVLYAPFEQIPTPSLKIIARTQGDPMDMIGSIRSAIHSVDPMVPVSNFQTVDDVVRYWLRDDQMAAGFFGGLALLALGLASIGLYGVMSYSVIQRTHEIGIRVAMGAIRKDILVLVISRCLRLCLLGIGIGILISLPLGFVLKAELYQVSNVDPVAYASVTGLFLVVALLAGFFPARRATRVDPMTALRYE
ncbi:MAG: ABC transporter permease [Planctomycetes bacterium]|nr:ABC transporter permease [Planctomycetota bacterium]